MDNAQKIRMLYNIDISKLNEKDRCIVTMRMQGSTLREIGEKFGVSYIAIRNRLRLIIRNDLINKSDLGKLGLSKNIYFLLKRAGIDTVDDLCDKTAEDLMSITNLGRKSFDEVVTKMKQYGLKLKED